MKKRLVEISPGPSSGSSRRGGNGGEHHRDPTPGWISPKQTFFPFWWGNFWDGFFKLFRFQCSKSSDSDLDEFSPFGGSHFGGKLGNRNLKGKLERYQSKKLWVALSIIHGIQ